MVLAVQQHSFDVGWWRPFPLWRDGATSRPDSSCRAPVGGLLFSLENGRQWNNIILIKKPRLSKGWNTRRNERQFFLLIVCVGLGRNLALVSYHYNQGSITVFCVVSVLTFLHCVLASLHFLRHYLIKCVIAAACSREKRTLPESGHNVNIFSFCRLVRAWEIFPPLMHWSIWTSSLVEQRSCCMHLRKLTLYSNSVAPLGQQTNTIIFLLSSFGFNCVFSQVNTFNNSWHGTTLPAI